MADEITILVDASLSNGSVTNLFNPGQFTIDQTNARCIDMILSVGTTEEAVSFTDFTGQGFVFLQNIDPTNYVQFGLTGSYTGRLVAGDPPACFRLDSGATLYLKADTAACDVRVIGYDV